MLSILKESDIERIGRLSGFVQRRSKLTAYNFLLTLMFSRFDGDKLSLNDLKNELSDKFNCSLSKQSLNERFTDKTVDFLKMVISRSLANRLEVKNKVAFLGHFTALKIQDSTSFQLPKCMKNKYGGCGGAASGSMARIQFEYDIKSMNITTLEVTSGMYQDASFAKDNMSSIKKGELIMRDEGFVSTEVLLNISKNNAFFLNRLKTNQTVYLKKENGDYTQLDFKKLYAEMTGNKIPSKDIEVYLKKGKEYLSTRLIVEKIPDEIYNNRIRKAVKEAKKKGREISDKYKLRTRFNLFVTNVEQDILSTESVRLLYGVRWQIELIFKTWKSTFGIEKVKPMKKERIESQLYARLLLIMLSWESFALINNCILRNTKYMTPVILSFYKYCKVIRLRLESFMLALIFKGLWLNRFIENLILTTMCKDQYIEQKNEKVSCVKVFEMLKQSEDNQCLILSNIA